MKKLLVLLFSLFILSSPSIFADDISDFQIEGMSIGDSLLDYMTKDEILEEIEGNTNFYSYLNEPNKYAIVHLFKDFRTYKDGMQFLVKNNTSNQYVTNKNEKYTILYIRGKINFIEDFDRCIGKRDQIADILSDMFPNLQKNELVYENPSDSSGKSIVDTVWFEFDEGEEIDAYCTNVEENLRIKKNWSEGLSVSISSSETTSWLRNYK